MKARGGSGIVEKNTSRRGIEKNRKRTSVEYLVVGYNIVDTFIIFKMCKKESQDNEKIQFVNTII
jgi:hypothetical protein